MTSEHIINTNTFALRVLKHIGCLFPMLTKRPTLLTFLVCTCHKQQFDIEHLNLMMVSLDFISRCVC